MSDKVSKKTAGAGLSAEEKKAVQERAKELRAEAGRSRSKAKGDGEADVLAKLAEMDSADRVIAETIHKLVKQHAPQLEAKTWYGMPAYAVKGGKAVLFFQAASKFGARYATLGFNDSAALDEGDMWPTAFAITAVNPQVEQRIVELISRAAGGK